MFFAVNAALAAALTFLLPETKGKELPDSTDEICELIAETTEDE